MAIIEADPPSLPEIIDAAIAAARAAGHSDEAIAEALKNAAEALREGLS